MPLQALKWVQLDVDSDKKAVTTGVGSFSAAANEISLYLRSDAVVTNTQAIIGTFMLIRRYILGEGLNDLSGSSTGVFSCPVGGSYADIQVGTPDSDTISVFVPDEVYDERQSHVFNRVFDVLIDALLEEAK